MKKILKFSLLLLLSLSITACINIFKRTDLRPENISEMSNETKARQLLKEMGEAHHIEVWDKMETYNVIFGEEFYGSLGERGNPFSEPKMELSMNYIPKTFNGTLEVLSGKDKGDKWGIQNWKTYEVSSEGIEEKKNKDMIFWIPTYQYFIEFPLRIQEATAVEYLGSKQINGVEVEGVLASWNTVEPQKDIDQYIVWMNKETKRIVKIEYTVRDMFRFITGAAYFNNYKEFDGVLLPTEFPVESNLLREGYLHKMSIKEFHLNPLKKEDLLPLK